MEEGKEGGREREEEGKGMEAATFLVCEHIYLDFYQISLGCTLMEAQFSI